MELIVDSVLVVAVVDVGVVCGTCIACYWVGGMSSSNWNASSNAESNSS